MTPYPAAPVKSTITELYVDPATLAGAGAMEQGRGAACDRHHGRPSRPRCKVAGTYLIYSEVSYKYMPTIGYVDGARPGST